MKIFLLKRLKEPSTWAGIMLTLSAFGMDFTSEQQYALGMLGMALMGTPDKQNKGD